MAEPVLVFLYAHRASFKKFGDDVIEFKNKIYYDSLFN